MWGMKIDRWWESFIDLLFPRSCYICGELLDLDTKYLCEECLDDMPLTYYWSRSEAPSDKILWVRAYFERVIPLFFYTRESKYIILIHRIKYNGDIGLGIYMGKMLGNMIKGAVGDVDYIIPIPLHRRRKRKRGYNQAEIISWGVADALFGEGHRGERVLTDVLMRSRYTVTQTKKQVDEKWSNVKGAFELKDEATNSSFLEGKRVLLIDDVLTTGATMESVYLPLSKIKGIKVSAITLGFVE